MGDPVGSRFGRAVRSRRAELGITLEQLATACSVSPGALSRIERGEMNPSLSNASRIADALGSTLDSLIDDGGGVVVQRAADTTVFVDEESGVQRSLVATPSAGTELVIYRIPGSSRTPRFAPHHAGTIEVLHVLEGTLTIYSADDLPIELHVGDSAQVPADRSHQLTNQHDEPVLAVLLISRPRP